MKDILQERILKIMGILNEDKMTEENKLVDSLVDYWKDNNEADASEKTLKLFGVLGKSLPESREILSNAFLKYYGNQEKLDYAFDKWLGSVHKIKEGPFDITFKIKDINIKNNAKIYEVILDESSTFTAYNKNNEGDTFKIEDIADEFIHPTYGKLNSDDVYEIMYEIKDGIRDYIVDKSFEKFLKGQNQYGIHRIEIEDFAKENSLKESNIIEYYVETQEELKELMDMILEQRDLISEAEYRGRDVKLGKIMQGDVKKFKVYVKNEKGNVVKVNFGQRGMNIKKNNPKRRKSFRARHNCDNPGPRWKARYWACRTW